MGRLWENTWSTHFIFNDQPHNPEHRLCHNWLRKLGLDRKIFEKGRTIECRTCLASLTLCKNCIDGILHSTHHLLSFVSEVATSNQAVLVLWVHIFCVQGVADLRDRFTCRYFNDIAYDPIRFSRAILWFRAWMVCLPVSNDSNLH